jgi:hypothetical protein
MYLGSITAGQSLGDFPSLGTQDSDEDAEQFLQVSRQAIQVKVLGDLPRLSV